MSLEYIKDLNKVELNKLQQWLENYIKQNNELLILNENILVKMNTKNKNLISIKIDDSFNVWLYLYINDRYIDWGKFKYGELKGIDIKFIKFLNKLKNG